MKMAGIWTAAAILFFYGISNLGPTSQDNNPLGFSLMLIAFTVPMALTIKRILGNAANQRALFVACKALYEKALFDLQGDPSNPNKHQEALARGREYYAYLHPNTHDINANGVSSNFRDNSGIIESKVQSDIQARITKGKIS